VFENMCLSSGLLPYCRSFGRSLRTAGPQDPCPPLQEYNAEGHIQFFPHLRKAPGGINHPRRGPDPCGVHR